ncbi:MAG: ATP-binding protein [Thermoproteota archaeon]
MIEEFRRIVYEGVEVSSFRRNVERAQPKRVKAFKILGNTIVLGGNVFSILGRLVSEVRLRSADYENKESEIRMLQGLSATGFEGMFTISYEPFNYEVRFSITSRSLEELGKMVSRMKASILAGFHRAELEALKSSPEVALWPLGGFPVSRHKNTLILLKGQEVSAASFLLMRLEDDVSDFPKDALENTLRSSAESGCSLRFCVPVKSCNGVFHTLSLWAKKWSVSSHYSKVYRELRKTGLYNSKEGLVGHDLGKSAELDRLRLRYERLNGNAGCWTCSPVIVVVGSSAKSPEQAYLKQRNHVEAVKAAFSSSYGIKLEEVGWLSLGEVAKIILARRIVDSKKLHLTSDELSFFVNLPEPITPSVSYMPKRNVEFEAFNPAELERNGIFLGYYESMGRRLEVKIGVGDLPLHLAIFGTPGSGKSTLTKALLRRYRELGGFAMVFDRHGEYVDEFDDALVLNTGNAKINLLEHYGDPEGHAKVLSEVFAMAWPDEFGPLISHIFRRMYLRYIREVNYPDFINFVEFLEKGVDSEDLMLLRSGKARDKLFSLVGRLSELTQGSIGKVFNMVGGQEEMMGRLLSETAVFDLSDFDTDRDANIFTWMMLKQVYDYRRRNPNRGLPHVVVCEEAHNIAPAKFEGQETIVEKMLREMRKFGESVWLIDQRPLTVSRDVLGLCGTIVCLRLQYSSDVEKIADTMHLNEEQSLKLQAFKRGEAIVLLPGMNIAIPIMVQI